jgi:FtsP/CotA-like multicopper oxidase with cupredoxin domain
MDGIDGVGIPHGQAQVPRRSFLKLGALGTAALAMGTAGSLVVPELRRRGLWTPDGVFDAASNVFAAGIGSYTEAFPTSPLILSPFSDPLPIPAALRPVNPSEWKDDWEHPPGPGNGEQSSLRNEKHQIWTPPGATPIDPIVYHIKLQVNTHAFTTSKVLPIDKFGKPTQSFDKDRRVYRAGTVRSLPLCTVYGFNGTFPGPMINAEYGKPVLVRFENELDQNPQNLDRQDFGTQDFSFLTHLHNAHTAPESDGNPNYTMNAGPMGHGYHPGQWVDNLYLNWPAAGDDREKQSFFWFHDHRMHQTGSNVYKGMVGLYPIYDPGVVGTSTEAKDMGDETKGLRLPGVRTNNSDGSFDVKYDIPLAFYDVRLDDGVTLHNDYHDAEFADAGNPKKHPEWWGKSFFKHFPNHGFVGDIFTVNGTAYPVLEVERRKYRFRFLDASIARVYDFKLMSSTQGPMSAVSLGLSGNELQGQYRIPDGQQCMQLTQIASDGGLLPMPITRDSCELWPGKRREFVIDFTKYQDGTPTTKGDVIYLTDLMKMPDGRKWTNSSRFTPDPNYKIPVLKFVIGDPPSTPDNSVMPSTGSLLRQLPPLPSNWQSLMNDRLIFELDRSGNVGGEDEWLINGQIFDPAVSVRSLKNPNGNTPLAEQKRGSFALWELRNPKGGWVHPMHLHMEEHRTVMRNGQAVDLVANASNPDDASREDVAALDPGGSVIVYRGFRDFVGPYVAHCHNLAHEDHSMMFGWKIIP